MNGTGLALRACGALILAGTLQPAMAVDTNLCPGGISPCTLPAVSFDPGSGTISGNPGTDTLIVETGQTAAVPDQTYYNFGTIRNLGTFNSGDGLNTFPWLRIMGPGALLENFGVANNLTDTYVQDSSILGVGAPTGSGAIVNHSGATFNNGSSVAYGGIDAFDATEIRNDGFFNNYSYFYMESTASFVNNGVFTNYGLSSPNFGSDLLLEGTVTNSGTIHNTAGSTMDISGTFNNTATGRFINEGAFDTSAYAVGVGNLNNAGEVVITATATGPAPNFYSPGRFLQTAGSLTVDGQFVQSLFDISGGTASGGGVLDTTHSNVPGTAPTFHLGPAGTLQPGNGSDNSLDIIGDVSLEGELVIEIAGGGAGGAGQGTLYDFLQVLADTSNGSSTGYLAFTGQLTVELLGGFSAEVGDWFDIITAAGGITGDLLTPASFTIGNYTFEQSVVDGTTVRLTVLSAVPLPPALWLFASGLAALLGVRYRTGARMAG